MVDIARIAANCALAEDGIWYAAGADAVSYPAGGNEACFQVEDSSFWFRHRNACIAAAVRAFPPPVGEAIFDIGGGNGFVSAGLIEAGFQAVVVEPGPAGAVNAKRRGVPTVVCATTAAAGFTPGSMRALGLFDVIEHVEQDAAFLRSMRELLPAGGRLYATVPAFQALWSDEDVTAGHFRRYTLETIGESIQRAGFRIDYATCIFRPLPVPIFLFRTLPFRLFGPRSPRRDSNGASAHLPRDGVVSRWVQSALAPEVRRIAERRRMNFGGSCLVVATAQ